MQRLWSATHRRDVPAACWRPRGVHRIFSEFKFPRPQLLVLCPERGRVYTREAIDGKILVNPKMGNAASPRSFAAKS